MGSDKQPQQLKNILIIEDDEWFLDVITKAFLGDRAYKVSTAIHSIQALYLIDKQPPDIIFADVLLAGGTIFALLNELQSHYDLKQIPVVLCTNLAENFKMEELTQYGVKEVLDKSTLLPQDLMAATRRWVAH